MPRPSRTDLSHPRARPAPGPLSRILPGWPTAMIAALVMCATAPGQTAGVSVFINPMIADLGIPRSQISTAYMVGTLFGGLMLPFVGRWVDRFGSRRSMLVIGIAFAAALAWMAVVQDVWTVAVGYMLIRSLGQGALGLVAVTYASRWFVHHRGTALGFVSAAGSAGISLAPVAFELLLVQLGWRSVWLIAGLAVALVVVPLALLVVRDRTPQTADDGSDPLPGEVGMTRGQTLREPWFWVLTTSVAVSGMFTTAVTFHQIDLLQGHGLSSTAAAATFLPQSIAGIAATLVAGRLADRVSPRLLIVAGMLMHTVAFLWATSVGPGWSAFVYGLALGAAGAFARTVEIVNVPDTFGTRHLGAIRGVVSAVAVGSTALGPVLFAALEARTGSYTTPLVIAAVIPLLVAGFALIARRPQPASL